MLLRLGCFLVLFLFYYYFVVVVVVCCFSLCKKKKKRERKNWFISNICDLLLLETNFDSANETAKDKKQRNTPKTRHTNRSVARVTTTKKCVFFCSFVCTSWSPASLIYVYKLTLRVSEKKRRGKKNSGKLLLSKCPLFYASLVFCG